MHFKVTHFKKGSNSLKPPQQKTTRPPQRTILHTDAELRVKAVNRMALRDSFCSITGFAAMTNPLTPPPPPTAAFIYFQLHIQTPKEGNWHLKVNGAAERHDYREQASDSMCAAEILLLWLRTAEHSGAGHSSDRDEVSTEREEEN